MRTQKQYHSMKQTLVVVIVLMLVMALAACGSENEQGGEAQMPPPVVAVMEVEKTDVEIVRDYPARVHGSRQVQVRAMVQGILKQKMYEEGGLTEEDKVLFLIDPEPYEIALRRARAEVANASAGYDSALRERGRYERLHGQKAVSTQQRDNARTQYKLAHATLEMAKAAEADAERNLRYTRVRAPVQGVTDRSAVSEGNLIEWGRLLTTITQIDPVHIHFSLPERDALTHRTSLVYAPGDRRYRETVLLLPDRTEFGRKGEIDFTSSIIDSTTGTVTARAVFGNPDAVLVPGQFVRIRVHLEELTGIILVPETAISEGISGARLFVVSEEGMARERAVILGPTVEGQQVINEGLHEGDRVVVKGHVALRDGMPVTVEERLNDSFVPGGRESEVEVR